MKLGIKNKCEERLFLATVVINVIFCISSIAAALLTKSIALAIISAYNTCDLFLSLFSLYAFQRLHRPHDKHFHFGYGKLEPLYISMQTTLVIAICLIGFLDGLQHLVYLEDEFKNAEIAIIFSVFQLVVDLVFWKLNAHYGKALNSPMLITNALSCKVEAISSVGMFFGLFLIYQFKNTAFSYAIPYIDPILSIAISVFLAWDPISLLKESIRDLLDVSPGEFHEKEILAQVNSFIKTTYNLENNATLKLRKSGRQFFAIIHYKVDGSTPFKQVHDVNHGIKLHLESRFPHLHVVCHPEEQNSS